MQRQSSNLSTHPLCFAVALALTALAGCSTSSVERQQVAETAAGQFKDDGRLDHDESKTELDSIAVGGARRTREEERVANEMPSPAPVVFDEPSAMAIEAPPPAPPAPPYPLPSRLQLAAKQVTGNMQPASPVHFRINPIDVSSVESSTVLAADDQILAGEKYAVVEENPIVATVQQPTSTFSIDVDTGSYSNVRRILTQGMLPPPAAVRAEEMINYFDYDYAPSTRADRPFSVTTELATAPWSSQRQLLLVGIKGYQVAPAKIPASNMVLLIDTSGSMQSADKIGLLKQSLSLLIAQMRPQDRLAIVTYAGNAGLVLPSTTGKERGKMLAALDRLEAGGSTNGAAGIELAYDIARDHFIDAGVNRVVLATDGDFNVGTTSVDALKQMVEVQREDGIALTTLGFGQGNYNDELAEQLADIGNGNHAYIDTLEEGQKVLVDEMSSTMLTIAKDVKIQVEFNPAVVSEYRLIGYENRRLRNEDFANDKIDAGEIGAGHDVTALYEIALVGSGGDRLPKADHEKVAEANPFNRGDLGELRLRFKAPDGDESELIAQALPRRVNADMSSPRIGFATAVAAFAEILKGSERIDGFNMDQVAELARSARGSDPFGYRGAFLELLDQAAVLKHTEEARLSQVAE
ncbi:MAG: VWA domain-containing protein [Lysobacteraceae bacterium]